MKVIGNPRVNNESMKNNIQSKLVLSKNQCLVDERYLSSLLSNKSEVLDIGKSLRDKTDFVRNQTLRLDTLDINEYKGYPDIQMDLCEVVSLPASLKYDVIYCFSILEHCYNPFIASQNLF